MKKLLLLFIMGVMSVLVLLEVIFRILPVSTATRSGYYIHPLILTYPPHMCFTVATGWDLKNAQHNCTNNFGFLADRDFVKDPQAIALIGDSFVEANMLTAHDRLAAQLETKLAGKPVYALGGPGSSLLDYAERAKFAADKFGTKTFVFVLERWDVKQAICGSGNIHGPCIELGTLKPKVEVQAPPDGLKRVLRESAFAQYLFSQLKLGFPPAWLRAKQPQNKMGVGNPTFQSHRDASSVVVSNFLEKLSKIEGARYLILIDPDRANLFTQSKTEFLGLKELEERAPATGVTIIDTTQDFRNYNTKSGRILEVGPYDKHWNREGVQIMAAAITKNLASK